MLGKYVIDEEYFGQLYYCRSSENTAIPFLNNNIFVFVFKNFP